MHFDPNLKSNFQPTISAFTQPTVSVCEVQSSPFVLSPFLVVEIILLFFSVFLTLCVYLILIHLASFFVAQDQSLCLSFSVSRLSSLQNFFSIAVSLSFCPILNFSTFLFYSSLPFFFCPTQFPFKVVGNVCSPALRISLVTSALTVLMKQKKRNERTNEQMNAETK